MKPYEYVTKYLNEIISNPDSTVGEVVASQQLLLHFEDYLNKEMSKSSSADLIKRELSAVYRAIFLIKDLSNSIFIHIMDGAMIDIIDDLKAKLDIVLLEEPGSPYHIVRSSLSYYHLNEQGIQNRLEKLRPSTIMQ